MTAPTAAPRLFVFAGGDAGAWQVRRAEAVCGAGLPAVAALDVSAAAAPQPRVHPVAWQLRGITSNERYVTRDEKSALVGRQEAPGRPQARCAALIPIRKSAAWWALTQDERREVFEAQSAHIAIGLRYCRRSLGGCTIAATWGPTSPSTSSPGSISRRSTSLPSTNCCWPCAVRPNGAMSSARSTSGCSAALADRRSQVPLRPTRSRGPAGNYRGVRPIARPE